MKLRNLFFSHRPVSGISVAWGVALVFLVAGSAQATLVNLSFSGTYDTLVFTVFGVSGPAIPYNHQITYDTTLDTNTFFFASGASLGSETTTHEWYGYSASGITATSLTFGNQTWTVGDLIPSIPAVGVTADLWFDTDISVSTPTRSWVSFQGGSPGFGSLLLGGGVGNGVNIFMEQHSSVTDFRNPVTRSALMTIERTVVAVPEPTTLALVGLGVLALAGRKLGRRK
jgi:hypothetical protein